MAFQLWRIRRFGGPSMRDFLAADSLIPAFESDRIAHGFILRRDCQVFRYICKILIPSGKFTAFPFRRFLRSGRILPRMQVLPGQLRPVMVREHNRKGVAVFITVFRMPAFRAGCLHQPCKTAFFLVVIFRPFFCLKVFTQHRYVFFVCFCLEIIKINTKVM